MDIMVCHVLYSDIYDPFIAILMENMMNQILGYTVFGQTHKKWTVKLVLRQA
jgi:hypothetical protein